MTILEKTESELPPACELRGECRTDAHAKYARTLFERPWDTFVMKRGDDGKYRSFVECCDILLPA